ncbi:hypothetical protein HJD18_15750 [Thermoleophilia bacterium SCSIO 60948]|nr:hypothetical protein HJD18_15750 [Thermoleophilia bacterium SCSIO 60948]
MGFLVPVAHLATDHWYGFLMYLAPVAIVVASIAVSTIRQRRELAAKDALADESPERHRDASASET